MAHKMKLSFSKTKLSQSKNRGCHCPQNAAKLWQGRCEGFEARLLPNVAFWRHYKSSWKAPRMLQKPPPKAPRGSWSQATAPRMQQQPVARAPRHQKPAHALPSPGCSSDALPLPSSGVGGNSNVIQHPDRSFCPHFVDRLGKHVARQISQRPWMLLDKGG